MALLSLSLFYPPNACVARLRASCVYLSLRTRNILFKSHLVHFMRLLHHEAKHLNNQNQLKVVNRNA